MSSLVMNFIYLSQQNYFNALICICLYIRLNTLVLKYYFFIIIFSLSLSQPKRLKQLHRNDKSRIPHHRCHHNNTTPQTHSHHLWNLLSLHFQLRFLILFHINTIANPFTTPTKSPSNTKNHIAKTLHPLHLLPWYGFSTRVILWV